MALNVVTNVLAVIGGGLVSTGFQDSLMPRASTFDPKHGDSAVRVAVALNGGKPGGKHFDPVGADGRAPGVLVYNPLYDYVGHSDWKHRPHIGSGSYTDLTIYQEIGPGQQTPWVQLYAGDDAICVAYVSQRMSDGTELGWLGDMGRACGQNWYHSNVALEGTDRSPDCVWLNRDHARDQTKTGNAAVQINMMAFNNATLALQQDPNIDPSQFCSSDVLLFRADYHFRWEGRSGPPDTNQPRLWNAPGIFVDDDTLMDPMNKNLPVPELGSDYDPDWYDSHNDGVPHRTRRARSRGYAAPVFNHLVTSNLSQHSASRLCEDDRSFGPDFVSYAEGRFCDMQLKEHVPICLQEEFSTPCFDASRKALVGSDGSVAKNYTHVVEW